MPNPFFNKQKNTSTEVPNTPQRIDPLPESYAGDNLPYRGLVNHGVKETDKPVGPVEHFDRGAATLPVYHDYVPEPEPIPVRVVGEGGSMIASRIAQVPIPSDGTVTQILPRMKNRKTAIVQNGSGGIVTLLTDRNGQTWMGYSLAANAQFTVNAQTELYASSTAGSTVTVYVEYYVEEES